MKKSDKIIESAMADLNSNPEWTKFIDFYKQRYRKVLQLSFIIYFIGILTILTPMFIVDCISDFNISQHLYIFYIGGAILLSGVVYYIIQGMIYLPKSFNKISLKMYLEAIAKAS